MIPEATEVGLLRCPIYQRQDLKETIDHLCSALSFSVRPGDTVLLKPNLITALRPDGLACTHPEFIAATVEWCLDQSAKVIVGDSPAFGSTEGVMRAVGIAEALQGLSVTIRDFKRGRRMVLAGGSVVHLAEQVFDCDILINLPKVKAHSQLLVTLAVKNFFGAVVGMHKAWYHVRYGDRTENFAELLVDLLTVLPAGISLADGIVAMHGDGPVKGRPFPLHVVAGSVNPVALETALMDVLGLEHGKNPLWLECARRKLPGADPSGLVYPLLAPDSVRAEDFQVPGKLKPVSFNPLRMAISAIKRTAALYGN
jgi:uncharacterized protein (DUF362 family)